MPSGMVVVIFFVMLLLNIPISIALGAAGILMILLDGYPLLIISSVMYSALVRYVMLAIPFFILAGIVMEYAGISRRLVDCARAWLGHIRGGMLLVLVAVCCFFGAISGSGTACIAAVGGILIPAMVHDGYDRGMSTALMSMSGGIGLIIPPSITFVVYAVVANVSILDMFIAGIIPGLLLGVVMVLTGYWCIRGDKNIVIGPKLTLKEKLQATKDAFWGLLAPVIILGGIYSGIFTPTEAAGVSVIYCLIVGVFIYKELKLKDLKMILFRSGVSSASIMFIIMFANVFAWYMSTSQLAAQFSAALLSLSQNPQVLMLIMVLLYLIGGCFLDSTSLIYVIFPIMLPVCKAVGIDLVHFGVVSTFAVVVGLVTPPVGVNLYVGAKIGEISSNENARKSVPFIIAALLTMLLVLFVPELSLWLGTII